MTRRVVEKLCTKKACVDFLAPIQDSELPSAPEKLQDGKIAFGKYLNSCNALHDQKINLRFLYVM